MTFEKAVIRLEAALKAEGFGVLCQIDIQQKLQEKLGVDFPRYAILGACNPPQAHQGLRSDMNLGLLLPCNAVVYEKDGCTWAGVVDAGRMLSITGTAEMSPIAEEVNGKLRRALGSLLPA